MPIIARIGMSQWQLKLADTYNSLAPDTYYLEGHHQATPTVDVFAESSSEAAALPNG